MKRSATLFSLASAACLVAGCLTFTVPSVNAATISGTAASFSALSIANVPTTGAALGTLAAVAGQTSTGVATQAVPVTIQRAKLTGNTLSLAGMVHATSFALSGRLYQGAAPGTIEGSLTDSTGNFVVLRCEIVNHPSTGMWLTSKAATADVPYLGLYLEQTGTRHITFIEEPASTLLSAKVVHTIESSYTTYAPAPAMDSLWLERMMLPNAVQTRSTTPVPNAAVAPDGVTSTSAYKTYSATYQFAGSTFTDTIEAEISVTYPPDTSSSGSALAQIRVDTIFLKAMEPSLTKPDINSADMVR